MLNFSLSAAGILLVFYLYLIVRPQCVKRGLFAMIGAGGLALAIFGGFFAPWAAHGKTWAMVLTGLFSTIGALVALFGAIMACCGKLAGEGICKTAPCEPAKEGPAK